MTEILSEIYNLLKDKKPIIGIVKLDESSRMQLMPFSPTSLEKRLTKKFGEDNAKKAMHWMVDQKIINHVKYPEEIFIDGNSTHDLYTIDLQTIQQYLDKAKRPQ